MHPPTTAFAAATHHRKTVPPILDLSTSDAAADMVCLARPANSPILRSFAPGVWSSAAIHYLLESLSRQDIAQLRLVSRAWNKAVQQHCTVAAISLKTPKHLLTKFPRLADITLLDSRLAWLDVHTALQRIQVIINMLAQVKTLRSLDLCCISLVPSTLALLTEERTQAYEYLSVLTSLTRLHLGAE